MATPLDYQEEIERHTAEAERYRTLSDHARKRGHMNEASKYEACAVTREREADKHLMLMQRLVTAIGEEQTR